MTALSFGCELTYNVKRPSRFIFNIEAARIGAHAGLRDSFTSEPKLPLDVFEDQMFGNRYVGLNADPGPLSVRYSGEVDLTTVRCEPAGIGEVPMQRLPLGVFPFLQPSRFCESDRLAAFALREFCDVAPGHLRITAICNWIYDHIAYRRGSSDPLTSAADTLLSPSGVCRDFAHLGIAFCRALNIPARFVSAYAYGLTPGDFHAMFEAYLDGGWWLFDPTRQAALDRCVRIGIGRDAAEVSFASIYGEAEAGPMRVFVTQDAAVTDERITDAVSSDGAA